MKSRLNVVAASVMAAVALGFTSAAHAANPFIRLDNSSNPAGSIGNTGTNNTISVSVRFCGSQFFTSIGSRALPGVSGQHDFAWTPTATTTHNHVTEIRVGINGNDWFWLDQIELFNSSGSEIWESGIDNLVGYCFSTDPTDGSDAACFPNDSQPYMFFDVPSPLGGCAD